MHGTFWLQLDSVHPHRLRLARREHLGLSERPFSWPIWSNVKVFITGRVFRQATKAQGRR